MKSMNLSRRTLLKAAACLPAVSVVGFASLGSVGAEAAFNKTAYEAKSIKDALAALGAGEMVNSDKVSITAADIAENGAVVPVAVSATIDKPEMIAILVEKNPSALAADFTIVPGMEAFVSTRVKMGQTSDVYAAVRSGGKWFVAKKEIKVTLGGCGG